MDNINGLNNKEVIINRKKYGSNQISDNKNNSFIKLLLESLGDPIIKILLIALTIKIVFLFSDFDWFETLGIIIAILLASLISSISEYGSEKAFTRLQEESAKTKTRVVRENNILEIPIDEVVKNDIVILSFGDKIPADGFILKGSIYVDESSLNGESKEIEKKAITGSMMKDYNKVYRGSVVTDGECYVKINNVGENTLYGAIANELKEKSPESPLKIRLRHLAKIISKIGYLGAILVSLSYLFSVILIKNHFDGSQIIATLTNFKTMADYFLYALTLCVTVIVVAVPEGLPMMITLVLSSNMKKMLKNNVLVRKMVGIETSGSLNILFTDKTGTLTKGNLETIGFIDSNNNYYNNINEIKKYPELYKLVETSFRYNNAAVYDDTGNIVGGNITDKAILKFIENKDHINFKIKENIPFNSKNKYSMTIINNGKDLLLVKGAYEKILVNCDKYYDQNGNEKIFKNKEKIIEKIKDYTKKGIRVLTFAIKEKTYDKNLNNLTFLGFALIKDEVKESAKKGIELVKSAGIQTIMITGDSIDTATSIAKDIGLVENDNDLILSSNELKSLSDDKIKDLLPRIKVIARALPTDKSRLVALAQEKGLVTGMTGDGVNDAPALKKADVGFAMGSGTEVSKEAADIVILDNDFLSISKAILYGRTIFKSIRKFIIFQLTVNICALVLSIIGPFIGINTPITIIQMLWINMIMDTFAGIAFSFEPPLEEYMDEKPKSKNEPIINKYMYGQIIFTGLYSALICLLFLKLPLIQNFIRSDINSKYLMTAYFALFIFIGIFNAFNARTSRINILANIKKNKVFVIIIGFIFLVQIYLIYFGGNLFRTYGLTLNEFLLVIILSFSVVPFDMFRKFLIKDHKNKAV